MANSSPASLVKGSLEECIAKALPTQTENGVKNLAKTLRDIGVESPDDIQYVEAADLASVLKPVQIRKLLQQVKADLNQGAVQKMSFSTQAGQVQSAMAAFQEQSLQSQLPPNLAGMCIQIPTSNISPSLTLQTVSSDKVHHPIVTYSEQNPTTNVLSSVPEQYPGSLSFTRSQMNAQSSEDLNYISVNLNQENAGSDLRVQASNLMRQTQPFLVNPHQIERNKATSFKGINSNLSSFADHSAGIAKGEREIVDLSLTEVTSFDSSMWDLEETNTKTLVQAPIVVSDDSNSSVICESSNPSNFHETIEHALNDSLSANQQTPDLITMRSSENNSNENSDCLEDFKIPWDKMPSALIEKLQRNKCPERSLRREMIRVVIAEMIKVCARPTRPQLQEIARKMVSAYPDSLLDPTENSNVKCGYSSIFKQLQSRLENINRPDRGQFNYQKKLMLLAQKRNAGKLQSKYGCINWQPVKLPPNETKWSLRLKQNLLKDISMRLNWDVERVTSEMVSTFYFQRKDINNGASISTLLNEWPFLFKEIGIMVHFKELTGVDLKVVLKEIIGCRARKVIDFMKTVQVANGQAEINKILKTLSKEGLNQENQVAIETLAMIPLVMIFLNEDQNILFPVASQKSILSIKKAQNIPETPCLICGESIFNSSRFVLCINKEVVNDKITNFLTGLMMLFASYYCFNIHYPVEASATLEFIQRCLVGINPMNKSGSKQLSIHPKVSTLLTGLTKLGWKVPNDLNNSLIFPQESPEISQWNATTPSSIDTDLTIVCSNQKNFINLSADKTHTSEQLLSTNSKVLEPERLIDQNASNGANNEQFSSDQISFMIEKPSIPVNDDLQCLDINPNPSQTYRIIKAALEQTKPFPETGTSKNYPRLRLNRPRGRGRGRGNSNPRSRGNAFHRRSKEWIREYWRVKKRESRARQKYWLKPIQNEGSLLNSDLTPVIKNRRKRTRLDAVDISNMPSPDRGLSNNIDLNPTRSPNVEPEAILPQAPPTLATPPPLHLAPSSSDIPELPPSVYKFELQLHSSWLTTRFCDMWKRRLLCNAAVGNGFSSIMVHRDVLLASCLKLVEESNIEVFQENFLQLTFTRDIKEEALWSFCHYIYEGFLILNADIIENMETIGRLLAIPYLLDLVSQYKQCALSDPQKKTEKEPSLAKIKQEPPCPDNSDPCVKPFVKVENVESAGILSDPSHTSWSSQQTAVSFSTVMTGVVTTKQPDYSNAFMVVVEVDSSCLSDKNPDHSTRLSSLDTSALLMDAENITCSIESNRQVKIEGVS